MDWLLEVDKYASAETAKLLIGNKSDRTDRAVTTEEGQALARLLGRGGEGEGWGWEGERE